MRGVQGKPHLVTHGEVKALFLGFDTDRSPRSMLAELYLEVGMLIQIREFETIIPSFWEHVRSISSATKGED